MKFEDSEKTTKWDILKEPVLNLVSVRHKFKKINDETGEDSLIRTIPI